MSQTTKRLKFFHDNLPFSFVYKCQQFLDIFRLEPVQKKKGQRSKKKELANFFNFHCCCGTLRSLISFMSDLEKDKI